jgi:WS/DGAT/MGAT family acyltransferase
MDLTPEPRAVGASSARRRKTFRLGMTEMLRGVLGSQAQKVATIIRELPSTVGTLSSAASKAVAGSALLTGNKRVSNVTLAPRTPLNLSVTTGRAFAAVTLPLKELKLLAKAHQATLNEMVLLLCSTALRRFYAKRRQLPRKSLVAAVPITLRESGDTSPDNQASMSLISLGTHIADLDKRLAHVKAASAAMKSSMGRVKSILPTDFPSLGIPWLIEAATALYGKARVADRIPQLANLVISNVPGPPVPLYMAGARMLTNYPTSIVVHGLALNITVQSYDQSLDFGLMADAVAMPDVRELADAILIAHDDLKALLQPDEAEPDESLVSLRMIERAGRSLTGAVTGAVTDAVGKVAKQVMGAAVDSAVKQVTRRGSSGSAAKRRRGR